MLINIYKEKMLYNLKRLQIAQNINKYFDNNYLFYHVWKN